MQINKYWLLYCV